MDLTNTDINVLAAQLRKPEGEFGNDVGAAMAHFNMSAIAFTIECLQIQPGDHLLEIGFGPGEAIAEAVRLTPHGYIAGIDHSSAMLTIAEQRNHRAIMQEHVELTLGDARKLPYEDDSFDTVFAVNVFHFWPDSTRELAECRRVLKSGGRIVFFLTHPSSWLPGIRDTGVFVAREAEDVEKILVTAGFGNVQSHTTKTEPDGKGFVVMGQKE
ncbi:MAG TPA: methyltransferase domain-containing protein [Candidatus Peribacteraceae bacterium]|nr:methyltransferase domain-containing protein [Candidatus Peribacteraceae bacterium]